MRFRHPRVDEEHRPPAWVSFRSGHRVPVRDGFILFPEADFPAFLRWHESALGESHLKDMDMQHLRRLHDRFGGDSDVDERKRSELTASIRENISD